MRIERLQRQPLANRNQCNRRLICIDLARSFVETKVNVKLDTGGIWDEKSTIEEII